MTSARPTHPGDDSLFDLAHGLLPADAGAICLDHLATCPECETKFREMTRDRQRALASAPRAARVKSGWATVRRVSSHPWWAALVAAAAAAVILLILLPLRPEPEEGPPPYWLPVNAADTLLRSSPVPARYTQALRAYELHDAARVVEILGSDPIPRTDMYMRLIYASALLLDGRVPEAEMELSSLRLERLPEPSRRRAKWILYACACRLGERQRAETLLAELSEEPDEIGNLARTELLRRGARRP